MKPSKSLFSTLKKPYFVRRWGAISPKELRALEKHVGWMVEINQYKEYLTKYNTFHVFEWKPHDQEVLLDKDYYWEKEIKRSYFAGEHVPKSPTVFLKSGTNLRAFQSVLQIPNMGEVRNGNFKDFRCVFQDIPHLRNIHQVYSMFEGGRQYSPLQLVCMGIKVDTEQQNSNHELINYMQPILDNVLNKYKDLNYEKLISIAKGSNVQENKNGQRNAAHSSFKVSDSDDVRIFLSQIAELGLTTPKLVYKAKWLLFKKKTTGV